MAARFSLARKKAQDLLKQAQVQALPVPVERLATTLGATIRYEPFEGDLSGVVHRKSDGKVTIGINSLHSSTRKRYTIAHELGHLLLHSDNDLHVDGGNPIGFRTSTSSLGTDDKEIEANQFAAELLMPLELVRQDVLSMTNLKDRHVDDIIDDLASRYQVSIQAMTIRLSKLGLVW